MKQHQLQNMVCVLVGLVLACLAAALFGGLDPMRMCPQGCATLNGLSAVMGPSAVRLLLAALCAALALGFTVRGLRKPR